MTGKREQKRKALRCGLLEAAKDIVKKEGARALNARSITSKAGCALGSLYTAYADLDDLIIHMNSETLSRLGDELSSEIEGETDPEETLRKLAVGYVEFARNNFPLWNTLFDYAALSTNDVPEWHEKEQSLLVDFIKRPVMELSPGISEEEVETRARTLFAAVHGIVAFSLQNRFIGLIESELEPEVLRFVDQMLAGLESRTDS